MVLVWFAKNVTFQGNIHQPWKCISLKRQYNPHRQMKTSFNISFDRSKAFFVRLLTVEIWSLPKNTIFFELHLSQPYMKSAYQFSGINEATFPKQQRTYSFLFATNVRTSFWCQLCADDKRKSTVRLCFRFVKIYYILNTPLTTSRVVPLPFV